MKEHYIDTPTQFVEVDGAAVAYRSIGTAEGTPIVYLNHLAANLDNCDPQLMDALAADFKVISFDYPGMGLSAGKCATSVEEMAREAIAFIRALGYTKVHLLGLSLGGFVAQSLLAQAPELVDRVILAGTGPAGDKGIARVPRITYYDMLRGLLTARDPRYYLFFRSQTSRQSLHFAHGAAPRSRQVDNSLGLETAVESRGGLGEVRSPRFIGSAAPHLGGERRQRPHGADGWQLRHGASPAECHADHH